MHKVGAYEVTAMKSYTWICSISLAQTKIESFLITLILKEDSTFAHQPEYLLIRKKHKCLLNTEKPWPTLVDFHILHFKIQDQRW